MVVIGGYEDSLRRLGVQSWQAAGAGAAPSYHFDMLQDTVRNEAYRRGIEATVEEDDLVVDIGTGSGLLALMAAKAGAHHVFAVEGDPALERAARRVVAANGKAESVTVVGRHSTQVRVGFGADVPSGADVIVTEIFDSWLLGEGMVPVMHDAIQRGLLAPHGRVVPAGAQIWAVLVESEWLARHQELPPSSLGGCVGLLRQHQATERPRWSPVEPLQVHANMLEARGLGRRLSAPFPAQAFDFARPLLYENRTVHVEITSSGRVDAVVLWWTADMDGSSGVGRVAPHDVPVSLIPDAGSEDCAGAGDGVRLSTRPCAMDHLPDNEAQERDGQQSRYPPPEREHWRQAACVLPVSVDVSSGQSLALHCAHTGTNAGGCAPRFALAHPSEFGEGAAKEPPLESASSLSTSFPGLRRCHLLQLGDPARERLFLEAACRVVREVERDGGDDGDKKVILALGDGPLLALAFGRAVAKKGLQGKITVVCLQSSLDAASLARQVVAADGLHDVVQVHPVVDKGQTFEGSALDALLQTAREQLAGGSRAAAVVGEPSYHALAVAGAGGTWLLDEVVRFHSEVCALRSAGLLGRNCRVMPGRAALWCRPLRCGELWRRRNGRLTSIEGVDLHEFNSFRPRDKDAPSSDAAVEPPAVVDLLPWEGSLEWLCPPHQLLDIDLAVAADGGSVEGGLAAEGRVSMQVEASGIWHGVAMWMTLSLWHDAKASECSESSATAGGEGFDYAGETELMVDASAGSAAGYSQALSLTSEPQELGGNSPIGGKCGGRDGGQVTLAGRLRWLPREMQAQELQGAQGVRAPVVAAVSFARVR